MIAAKLDKKKTIKELFFLAIVLIIAAWFVFTNFFGEKQVVEIMNIAEEGSFITQTPDDFRHDLSTTSLQLLGLFLTVGQINDDFLRDDRFADLKHNTIEKKKELIKGKNNPFDPYK